MLPTVPKSETEDDVISQIKDIASQLLESDFDQFCRIGLQIGRSCQIRVEKDYRTHSYTDRKFSQDREDCQSEWVHFDEHDTQHMIQVKQSKDNPQKSKMNKQAKNAAVEKKTNFKKYKKQQRDNQTKTSPTTNNKAKEDQVEMKQSKLSKINIKNIDGYGFMKQTRQLKPDLVSEIYKKIQEQQKQQEQSMKEKQNLKTLEQLYGEKQPLYQKYLNQRNKKLEAIYQSRVSEESKQMQQMSQKIVINNNIKVEGNFQERLKQDVKKVEENKSKIMNQMLKDSPFQPQINKPTKYKKIQSKIKKVWSQKNIKLSDSNSKATNKEPKLKEKADWIIQNNNKSASKAQKSSKNYSTHDYKLNTTSELYNILEIDDNPHD